MITPSTREDSVEALLPLFLSSDGQESDFDLRPRTDGIKFIRGILLGVIFCIPFWAVVGWLLVHRT